jgi:hypothetical protein
LNFGESYFVVEMFGWGKQASNTAAPTEGGEGGGDSAPAPGAKPKKGIDVVFVDDDPLEIAKSVGFSPTLFLPGEFNTLKKFCNARKLHQRHLNQLFKRYLSKDEVYLRDFRVRVLDVKEEFDDMSLLYREVCEIFVPMLYQKPFNGLKKAHSMDEVTFPRFVILTYIFCAMPMPDLIFEMFCILKQKFNLKTSATTFAYNVEQLSSIMTEEFEDTWTLKMLRSLLKELPPDKEYDVGTTIKMAIKYPLIFYFIKRFRKHLRRIFLGDKFWDAAKALKTKLKELEIKKGYEAHFQSERAATLATNRAILADIYGQPIGAACLTSDPHPLIDKIDDTVATHLKKSIGYNMARKLILESELPLKFKNETSQQYITGASHCPIEVGDADTRFHDNLSEQDLKYDNGTGRRAWVCRYTDYDDEDKVLKEIDIDVTPEMQDNWDDDESEWDEN